MTVKDAKSKSKSDDFIKVPKKSKKKRVWKLSASMMKTFLKCKKQFYENYLTKTAVPVNESFSLGNGTHHALELANNSLIENPRDFTLEEIEGFLDEGRKYVAEKAFVGSMETFVTMETLISDELQRPFEEKVLASEVKFDIVTPEGVPVTGYIDKVTLVDNKTIRILDYKTSRTAMSTSDAEFDEQLSMYDLAGTILWPEYPNRILELRYLRLGESVVTTRSEIAQYNFRKQIFAIFNAILEFVKARESDRISPEGSINPLCNWCSFRTKCKQFNEQLDQSHGNGFVPLSELDDTSAVSELQKANLIAKAIDSRKDELKLWMAQRIEADPGTPIVGDSHKINPLCISRRTYNSKQLAAMLTVDQLVEVSTISATKVNKLLQKLKDANLKQRIERAASVKFNSPQYRIAKK